MKIYSVVGKALPRVDGIAKATGGALFTADIKLPGMLYGKILRSPYPHARILNIDTSQAERLPGVKAVVTGSEIGPIRHAYVDTPSLPADEYILAVDKVRYIGEEVAAVAALDEDIAQEALSLIKVDYEELPAVFDPLDALKEGAPKIHEEIVPTTTTAWEDWGARSKARPLKIVNNICTSLSINYGDAERTFRESDFIREDRFLFPATSHAAMEPHVALASFEPSGKLNIWLSHMGYELKRFWLAKTLGIPLSKVRVLKAYVGGAFGGRLGLFPHEFLAAYLSRKTGKPVKIALSREEVFTACKVDHRMIIDLKTGVREDGTLIAQEMRIINDPGAYRGTSSIVLYITHTFSSAIYRIPNLKFQGTGVYTNKSVSMPKRGHGMPQARFAIESQMDMIAQDMRMDPLELRRRNIRKPGDVLPNGDRLESCGLPECLEKVARYLGWEERGKNPGKNRGLGLGISSMFCGTPLYPFGSAAHIKLNPDGTITLFTGATDCGQGSDTAMSQIAAEEMGVSLQDVELVSADSELCPTDMGNFLSLGVFITGEAVRRAAADAKGQLLEEAAQQMKVEVEALEIKGSSISVRGQPEKTLTFAQVLREGQRRGSRAIWGRGFCQPLSEARLGTSVSYAGRFTDAYSFAVAGAEVEVDRETGKAKVLQLAVADDSGFIINPLSVEGQIEGQAGMAIGDVLLENILTQSGQVMNPSFSDYKLPVAGDMPDVKHLKGEYPDPKGPYGAKEAGECARAAILSAIVNALSQATGVRINELPITPEKVLKALKSK